MVRYPYLWRGGEVVTLRSAKPPCAGSNPAHASKEKEHILCSFLLVPRAGLEPAHQKR